MRGRRSQNLYRGEWNEALLDRTVGDLRRELAVDGAHEARLGDVLLFAFWLAVGIYLLVWTIALAPALLLATLVYKLGAKRRVLLP